MGPTECHEDITERIYGALTKGGINQLDLFKKSTLKCLAAVVRRGESSWRDDDEDNYKAFRRLLTQALDRKDLHDRRCRGADGVCLDQQVKGIHRDLDDYALNALDLFTPTTLLILESVTRQYSRAWENEDRKTFKIFRNMLWAALERHAEELENCQMDEDLKEKLEELRLEIQSNV
jgi:hypothetical protein